MARLAACLRDLCEPSKLAGLLRAKREALPQAAVLQQHRLSELAQMRLDFNGAAYSAARKAFVFKQVPTVTPSHLAPHRQREAMRPFFSGTRMSLQGFENEAA